MGKQADGESQLIPVAQCTELNVMPENSSKLYCILQYKNPISHFMLHLAFLHNTVNEILPSCQKKIPIVRKTAV